MKDELTEREREVYDFILNAIRNEGYSPSVRDICEGLGIRSTSTVHGYLERLERKGMIQKESKRSRTLRVDPEEEGTGTVHVPIIGRVAAGTPILAVENYEGYLDFPRPASGKNAELFALRVKGESMIDAGIMDGDLIVVEKCATASDGEIVVALVDGDATVKTFYREDNFIRLQPENKTMTPIYAKELILLGKVVASLRFYR